MNSDTVPGLVEDSARSLTLPGGFYTDAGIFEREREAIHFRSWHYAGAAHELECTGDYITARVLDQTILIIRGDDGGLRAFYNVCQHRAHELLRGRGRVQAIVCPYHAWTYRLDGELLGARGFTVQPGIHRDAYALKPVRVEVFAEKFIFFNLDPEAAALASLAGDLAEELTREIPSFSHLKAGPGTVTVEFNANWKAAVDNYLECYHCHGAHPALATLLDLDSFRVDVHRYWMSHKVSVRPGINEAYPVSPAAANQSALWWWLWPTTTFNVLPGSAEVSVYSFMPSRVDFTVQWGQRFEVPGAPVDEAREQYRNGPLFNEDVALVESVQRGLHSRGYNQSRFIDNGKDQASSERAVHHFQLLVATALKQAGRRSDE